MVLPDAKWVGYILIALGIIVFVFDIRIEDGNIHWRLERNRKMGPIVMMAVGAVVLVIGAIWYYSGYSGSSCDLSVHTYSELNNSQLRECTIALSTEMRNFESDYERRKEAFYSIQSNDDSRQILQLHTEEKIDFDNKFFAQAKSLQDELLKRLGPSAPKPDPQNDPVVLRYQTLAGPYPISGLANYLEGLARNLP